MKTFASFLLGAALAGCATPTPPANPVAVAALQPGVATEDDVVALLGRPTFVTPLPDGTRMFIYSHRTNAPDRPGFLPDSGPFADLNETPTQTVQVLIGSDGRVLSAVSTDGAAPAAGGQ